MWDCELPFTYSVIERNNAEGRAKRMLTLEGLIAVLSLCVGCFSLGYAIGRRDNNKTQK